MFKGACLEILKHFLSSSRMLKSRLWQLTLEISSSLLSSLGLKVEELHQQRCWWQITCRAPEFRRFFNGQAVESWEAPTKTLLEWDQALTHPGVCLTFVWVDAYVLLELSWKVQQYGTENRPEEISWISVVHVMLEKCIKQSLRL